MDIKERISLYIVLNSKKIWKKKQNCAHGSHAIIIIS